MTPHQKQLVRESFSLVRPISDAAAGLFYSRLFEIAPETRALFKHDMAEQGRKLMQVIGFAAHNLDNPQALVPAVQALGRRHASYGVRAAHYATVAEALLWTLGKGLGDAWTSEHEDAWVAVYGSLSSMMLTAAVEVNSPPAMGSLTGGMAR